MGLYEALPETPWTERRGQVEPTEVKQDGRAEALLVAIAAGGLPDGFDLWIDALTHCVGDRVLEMGEDSAAMVLDGLRGKS